MDKVTEALLPCPFCGGEAKRLTIGKDEPNNAGGDVICCTRCQASSHVEFGRKENLVSRWNTRAQSPDPVTVLQCEEHARFKDTLENICRYTMPLFATAETVLDAVRLMANHALQPDGPPLATLIRAAATPKVTVLQEEVERLRQALREIAGFDYEHDDMEMQIHCAERARTALSAPKEGDGPKPSLVDQINDSRDLGELQRAAEAIRERVRGLADEIERSAAN